MDTNLFIPERGDREAVNKAVAICKQCDVRAYCANYGIELDQEHVTPGIFGGLSQHQRRNMKGAA